MDKSFLVLFFKKEHLKRALLLKKKQNFFIHKAERQLSDD